MHTKNIQKYLYISIVKSSNPHYNIMKHLRLDLNLEYQAIPIISKK